MKRKLKSIITAALCAVGLSAFANAESAAESDEGFLDLTVGDRIAKDAEPLVVDPAWGDAATAEIQIDGEGSARAYTSAGVDTWDTTGLEPGRYGLAFTAGDVNESAAFWKLGADWVVFDGSNVTADVTFEADKTYLILGTNMVSGATLTVLDGAKFFYDEGAPAGFKAASVAELPKRYEIADGVDPADESKLFQIVEKLRGSEDNPWDVGEGVTAYTNGTELVIGGEGTIADISGIPSEVMGGVTALTIAEPTVTGAEAQAFAGFSDVALTLPDGWHGELPDEDGNWYGATGVVMTGDYPLTVKNVTFRQRYPWNGKVDVSFTLTGPAGETNVVVTVCTNVTKIADFTAAVVIPADGVLETNLVWDAATAGLVDDFKSDDVTVEVAFAGGAADPTAPVQLWADGPYFATCNVGANAPEEYGWYFWWGDTVGYTNNGSAWVSVVDGTSIQFNRNDPTATNTYEKSATELKSLGYIDDDANPVLNAAHDAAKVKLGDSWRMMTKVELDALTNTAYCTAVWTDNWNNTSVKGYVVSGNMSGYTGKSIFLPAAGYGNGANITNPGKNGCYWSSTPDLDNSNPALQLPYALNISFISSAFRAGALARYRGGVVRAVRDTPPEDTPAPSAISASSEKGTVDVRTAVALEGETTIAGVRYSDTAWGAKSAANVTLGYTNETTGATGTLTTGLSGSSAADVDLPKKDGDYKLTHRREGAPETDLTSFATFTVSGYPLGSEGNPWIVGPSDNPDGTVAWTDGNGNVYFKPPRSTVSRTGLEAVTNAMGGASFPAKLIAADGSETNDLVMVLGASGTAYDTLAEALAANETSYTLYEVTGYFVSYNGGEGALGTMATDTFVPGVPTNLTANAYEIIGYGFAGWTTNGVDVAYADQAAGVDFAQPGETLSLTALWVQVETKPMSFSEITNLIAQATLPVTFTLDEDLTLEPGDKIVVPAGKDVTFAGIGKFDVTAERPALFCGYPVGTGLKPEDLDRFKTDKDVKAYYEDGKVVVRGRGETEEFPWLLGTAGHEDEVTAWAGDGMIFAKPTRGTASVAALQSMTNALGGYVPGPGELKVISADGSATNDVVMLLGSDGVVYDTLDDVLAANPRPETVRLFEVKGYWVSYDANGAAGEMATDMFIPTVPTNLTANAYEIIGYGFAGWTTNGVDVAYADQAAGVDFAQPGETLSLTALWTQAETVPTSYADLTNLIAQATLPVTFTLDEDLTLEPGDKVVVPADKSVTFAGTGKFDVSGIVPQFGEPVVVGEGFADEDALALFDAKGVSKLVFEDGMVGLIARGESADFPWVLDEESCVTAWVDPALTNLTAVVIDDGLPTAANAIDLVALTNNFAIYGYVPAAAELNALLKAQKDGGAPEYLKPVNWIGGKGEYATLEAALEAGETAVVPNFVTEEIPEEIVETAEGSDGETYTAVVENKPVGGVAEPVKAVRAEGLVEIAASGQMNVKLVVTPTDVAEVAAEVVNNLTNALLNALAIQEDHPMRCMTTNLVDLSVYFNDQKEENCELGSLIAIHVPWTIREGVVYGVARIHNGVAAAIPEGAANANADGEYFEIGAGNDELVLHVKNFSHYLIAEAAPDTVPVTLPAGVRGFTYVVSNLTAGAAIAPSPESPLGGSVYNLPIGAAVAIYCVPSRGFAVAGENPVVIDPVTADTTLEGVSLPCVVKTLLYPNGDGGQFVPPARATTYEGVVLDEAGAVAGTVAVKLGKPNKKGEMTVSATVKTFADKKTYAYKTATKKVSAFVNGPLALELVGKNRKSAERSLSVAIEGDALAGSFDGAAVDGARRATSSKDPLRARIAPFAGCWTLAFGAEESVEATCWVQVSKSGSVHVHGRLSDGTLLCSHVKAEVGDGWIAAPATLRKVVKGRVKTFAFRVAFDEATGGVSAVNVAPAQVVDAKTGAVVSVKPAAAFAGGRPALSKADVAALAFGVALDGAPPPHKQTVGFNAKKGELSGTLKWKTANEKGLSTTVSGKVYGVDVGGTVFGSVHFKKTGETLPLAAE